MEDAVRTVRLTKPFFASGEESILAFEPTRYWAYLSVGGQKTFEIQGRCDTCPYAFTKLVDAESVDIGGLSELLRSGIDDIPDAVITLLSRGLPAGEYLAALVDIAPQNVLLGESSDYFATEQGGIWASPLLIEGGRHYPRTGYYRTATRRAGSNGMFYEFVVPMHDNRSPGVFADWRERLAAGARPTVLAVGVGERRQPAVWSGEPTVTIHQCVAHYVLEGHHRIAAAAQDGHTITMLTALLLRASNAAWPLHCPDEVVQSFCGTAGAK